MDKNTVFIKLPDDCKIPSDKMISLMKWFQKWVDKDIKRISLIKEIKDEI